MNVFLKNRNFRQLLINQWISGFGDIVFYLALMNYVSAYSFAPLAIFIISASETLPQFIQVFTGVAADFQKNRTQKYLFIQFSKIVLYSLVTLLLFGRDFSFLILLMICLINFLSDSSKEAVMFSDAWSLYGIQLSTVKLSSIGVPFQSH